jgi:phosphinothricin acetyltransferase
LFTGNAQGCWLQKPTPPILHPAFNRYSCRKGLRLPANGKQFASMIANDEHFFAASGKDGKGGTMRARPAQRDDASVIAQIYNEGITDRVATFETKARSAEDVATWFDGVHPIIVVEDEGAVVAFAATSTYRPRACYRGVAEFSVYTARTARRRGAGRLALEALFVAAKHAGFWKLVSRVFVENSASRALLRAVGFREVGVYEKHAPLDGVWRDVVIVERLLMSEQPA